MQTSSEEEKQCDTENLVLFGYFCQAWVVLFTVIVITWALGSKISTSFS